MSPGPCARGARQIFAAEVTVTFLPLFWDTPPARRLIDKYFQDIYNRF